MKYPLVRALNTREGITVNRICSKLGLCARSYYEWLANPIADHEIEEAMIVNLLMDAHENDPAAGYRILKDDIEDKLAGLGLSASENRIARLCTQNAIFANHSNKHAVRRYATSPKPSHDDLLRRHFKADAPDMVWVTDITEHPTQEGKVYWCGIKDLCSNKIVGQATSSRMTADLTCAALMDALQNRGYPKEVIVHSDRGGQFNSRAFRAMLKRYGLIGSMGQIHTCADNAAMESFNALLQKNVLNQKRVWSTRSELIHRIYRWVNVRYNKERRQETLGKMTPTEYELIMFGIMSVGTSAYAKVA